MLRTHAGVLAGAVVSALALAVACGGSSDTGGSGGSSGAAGNDGSAGSAGNAGTSGSGGSSGSSGSAGVSGSGGSSGSAGASGSAGMGGSAGTTADAGSCAAPSDLSKAAVCISYTHDNVNFNVGEAGLDGQGILVVEVFDTPTPDDGTDGGTKTQPLATLFYPDQPDAGAPALASISTLPVQRIDGLPSTVYVRSIFVDNLAILTDNNLTWGAWIGGIDLSGGLKQTLPLDTVQLVAGQGTSITEHLTALRRLRVAMTLASGTTPLDDGQGPAEFVVWDTQTPDVNTPAIFGIGKRRCADVTGAGTIVEGFVIGTGDRWISAQLDDYNIGKDPRPGSIQSVEVDDAGVPKLPDANKITIAQQYTLPHAVELNSIEPLGDGGAPAPYACPAVDAGTD